MTLETDNAFEAVCASYNGSGGECFECVQPLCKAMFLAGAAHEREENATGLLHAAALLRGRIIGEDDVAKVRRLEDCAKALEIAADHIRARGKA